MARVDLNEIKLHAQMLANAEPRTYERLLRLFDQYTQELLEAMTEASTDEILVAKGRAQQARKFMQLLTEKPAGTHRPTV